MKHKLPDWDTLEAALINDDLEGFCLGCGHECRGVEPDAREYPCEVCGDDKVHGAQEILFMFNWEEDV